MDSDDDYQSLSPPKELSPHVQFRRLKRLKKSDDEAAKDPPLFDSTVDPVFFSHVDFAKLEALENDSESQVVEDSNSTEEANLSQESLSQVFGNKEDNGQFSSESNSNEEVNLSQESLPEGAGNEVENVDEMELGFDVEVKKTKRVLEFDDDVVGGSANREHSEELELEKKEIIGEDNILEEKEEKKKNKKKIREKRDSGDELKTKSRGSSKRREEKVCFNLEFMNYPV